MLRSLPPSEMNIPTEVLRRFGGITSKQKKKLYTQYQSLAFVIIPEYLKPSITTVEALDRYGVCQTAKSANPTTHQYFVCPKFLPNTVGQATTDARYCCGSPNEQYCCTLAEFISGIRVVSPVMKVSPSVAIGSILAALLLATFAIIVGYAHVARRDRKLSREIRSRSLSLQNPPIAESKFSFSSSRIPPSKTLISSRLVATRKSAQNLEEHDMKSKDKLSNKDTEDQPPSKRLLSGKFKLTRKTSNAKQMVRRKR